MHWKRFSLLAVFLTVASLLLMTGCGGSSPSPSVSVTASTTTVDGADTTTLTATVTNDKNAAGVSWTTSAGTLSSSTTSSTTLTAPTATSASQTVTVTATSIADATKTGTATITIPAKPAVTTASTNLTGAVGSAFSVQLQGSGGISPYKNWAVSSSGSALPSCLTLSSSGVLTTASGTAPTASCAGSYSNLIFTFSDSGTPNALTATSSALTVTIAAASTIAFTSSPAATATYNVAYSSAVAATGGAGALTYAKASGSLPPDLALASNGAITGTPKAADIGTWTFAVTAADSYGDSATSGNYSIVVSYPPLTVTTASTLPSGYGNTAYSQTLAASGGSGAGYSWAVTSGASSLTALNLSLSSAGVLSGTAPIAGGSATFGVQVTDSASNTGTATLTVTIKSGLAITTATTLPSGYGNTAYSQTLATSGGSGTGLAWTITSGSSDLTALNLSLSSAGVLSGTPPLAGGSASFGVQVTDSASNKATATFSLTINPGISVTAPTLTAAYPGAAYTSPAFTATGGNGGSYTWTMAAASGSSLPTGFTIGSATGVITATSPANSGSSTATYNLVVTATDSLGNTGTANVTLTIEAPVTITTGATLTSGSVGINYSQTLAASGGSGGYTWQSSDASNLTAIGLSFNTSTGVVSGTSPTQGSASFTATATDSQSHVSASVKFSVTINVYTAVSLSATQASLGAATQNASYTGSITASNGASPYTWTVNGTTLTSSVTTVSLNNGTLVANYTTGNTLSISGTPSSTTSVSLPVTVQDAGNNTASQTYSISVTAAAGQVSGTFSLVNNCSGSSSVPVTFTVTLTNTSDSSKTYTKTTDGSGYYEVDNVPFGTYTITPSVSNASSSVFYPTTYASVTLSSSNSSVTSQNFSASVGYNISGTVSYSGSQTAGRTYLYLTNTSCGSSDGQPGTSISGSGSYTIQGVPPGAYTLNAWMDTNGITASNASTYTSQATTGGTYPGAQAVRNANNPTGNTTGITVSNASVTGESVSLSDPSSFNTPTSNPSIEVAPGAGGVLISYSPSENGNSIEDANAYLVQWSTSPTLNANGSFATVTGSRIFFPSGKDTTLFILNNTVTGASTFTAGQNYYFQARSFNTAASTMHPTGWSTFESSGSPAYVTIPSTNTFCSSNCTTLNATVTIPSGVTIASGVPLYVGVYQMSGSSNGPTAIYSAAITSPVVGANNVSITVPNGSNYYLFGILDQNNDGQVDAGDVTNVHDNNATALTLSGTTTSPSVTLPSTGSVATVRTQYYQQSSCSGSSCSGYELNLKVAAANKLPVSVTLYSGPNLLNPIDFSLCADCGNIQYYVNAAIPGGTPGVGDTYNFTVTYLDGSTDQGSAGTINGKVTGWDGGSSVVGASNVATNLAIAGSNADQPNFTWTFPSNPSDFTYSFYLSQSSSCSGACTIWQIPGSNSDLEGFTYAETETSSTAGQITWGTDPSGSGSSPSGSLSSSYSYSWGITVQDSNGNSAQNSTTYQP